MLVAAAHQEPLEPRAAVLNRGERIVIHIEQRAITRRVQLKLHNVGREADHLAHVGVVRINHHNLARLPPPFAHGVIPGVIEHREPSDECIMLPKSRRPLKITATIRIVTV